MKTTFSDYRAFDGFLMPAHIVSQDESGCYPLRFSSLEVNTVKERDLRMAKVDPAVSDSLPGKYDYGNGAVLTVTRKGNHLFAQLTGQPKCEIFPKSETEYFWKVVDAQVSFVKDATGKVTKAIHHQNGQTIDAPKIQ